MQDLAPLLGPCNARFTSLGLWRATDVFQSVVGLLFFLLVSYMPLARWARPRAQTSSVCTVPCDICRQTSCAKACFKPALAELDTARVQYMAVRTRSGRRSGATPLNGSATAPYEWKVDALLTLVYLAVLYYWQ